MLVKVNYFWLARLGRNQAAAVRVLGWFKRLNRVEGGGGEAGLLYTALPPVFTLCFS